MKTIIQIVFSLCLFVFASCERDPCKDNACKNGGICFDGKCECPVGYSGRHCEIKLEPEATPVTPTTTPTYNTFFWVNNMCGGIKFIIRINNEKDSIESAYSTLPPITSNGIAQFNLPSGTYHFSIYGIDSSFEEIYFNGYITVNEQDETNVKIMDGCEGTIQIGKNGSIGNVQKLVAYTFYNTGSSGSCTQYDVYIDYKLNYDYTFNYSNGTSYYCGSERHANWCVPLNQSTYYEIYCHSTSSLVKTGYMNPTSLYNCYKIKAN